MTAAVIAREPELSLVDGFLADRAAGVGTLVIEGEAGIGKTALWLAGLSAGGTSFGHVLVSRPAETERTLPYVVLGDLFKAIPASVIEGLPAPRRRALESALLLAEVDGGPIDPRAIGAGALSVLTALSASGPLLLAIDDVQWVDEASATSLAFALRRIEGAPIRLLLSMRTDAAAAGRNPESALERAIDPGAIEHLRLGPLSLGAMGALVQARLGTALSRPDLIRLHEASSGNPFFSLELARSGSAGLRDPTRPVAVPETLERLLAARLDGLTAEAREALLLVAANGRLPVRLLPMLNVHPGTQSPPRPPT